MSLPSAPRVLMHVPKDGPAAPQKDNVIPRRTLQNPAAREVELTIEILDPPVAHRQAVDRYRLAIWIQWADGSIAAIRNANGEALDGTWPDISDGFVSVSLTLPEGAGPASRLVVRTAFVDPLGRLSGITAFEVP